MRQLQIPGKMIHTHSQPDCGGANGVAKTGVIKAFSRKKGFPPGETPEESTALECASMNQNLGISTQIGHCSMCCTINCHQMTTGRPRRQIARPQMTADERASDYRFPSADRTNSGPIIHQNWVNGLYGVQSRIIFQLA